MVLFVKGSTVIRIGINASPFQHTSSTIKMHSRNSSILSGNSDHRASTKHAGTFFFYWIILLSRRTTWKWMVSREVGMVLHMRRNLSPCSQLDPVFHVWFCSHLSSLPVYMSIMFHFSKHCFYSILCFVLRNSNCVKMLPSILHM